MNLKLKKGQFGGLQDLITPLVAIAIILAIGFLIIAETQDQIESVEGVNSSGQNGSGVYTSAAWNATSDTTEALSDIPGWLPIIVITVIGAMLIGLVAMFRGR